MILDRLITIAARLIPAASSSLGLGDLLIVVPEGTDPVAGGLLTVTDAADVAAALAADEITAAGADALLAALSQDLRPPLIRVATRNPATPATLTGAIDAAIAAGWDVGPVCAYAAADADLAALGTWLAVGARRWTHPTIVVTANADLLTAGKPAALSALAAIESCALGAVANVATNQAAAAVAGLLSAAPLVDGPLAMRGRVLGVPPLAPTGAQAAALDDNHAWYLGPWGSGNLANTIVVAGTRTYTGASVSAVWSFCWVIKQARAALADVALQRAIQHRPIKANPNGRALVYAAISRVLSAAFAVGHLEAGALSADPNADAAPEGYAVDVVTVGDRMIARITVRVSREVRTFEIDVTGQEV